MKMVGRKVNKTDAYYAFFREQYYLPLNRQMVELNPELYCEIAASQIARRNDYDMF